MEAKGAMTMKRKWMRVLLLAVLVLVGLAGCGSGTEEDGPEVRCTVTERVLTSERQEILRVPVAEDCKAMLHVTYTTDDQDGAVLWLENDGETLLMDELPAMGDGAYEEGWRVSEISLREGDNIFSLSAPDGGNVACQMTLSLDGFDPEVLLSEQMDPNGLN